MLQDMRCDCPICRCGGLTCRVLIITSKSTGEVVYARPLGENERVSVAAWKKHSEPGYVSVYDGELYSTTLHYPLSGTEIVEVIEAGILLV